MPFLNYTTEINVSRTLREIMELLTEAGAQSVVVKYVERQPVAVQFLIDTQFGELAYSLPANTEGVWRQLSVQSQQTTRDDRGRLRRPVPLHLVTREQAQRVGWRIIKDWLEAQLAIVEAGMVPLPQVFLPYQTGADGRTVYEVLADRHMRLLGPGQAAEGE